MSHGLFYRCPCCFWALLVLGSLLSMGGIHKTNILICVPKIFLQVWNDMRVSNEWQNFHFLGWTIPLLSYSLNHSFKMADSIKKLCKWLTENEIYNAPKGTLEWKQSWPPYWKVVSNQSAQNWPLQIKDFEGNNWWIIWPPWSFARILSMMTVPPCGHRIMMHRGT